MCFVLLNTKVTRKNQTSHERLTGYLQNEVRRENEVRSKGSAFPTLSAMMPDDFFVDLLSLDRVNTSSAHVTDSVSVQR